MRGRAALRVSGWMLGAFVLGACVRLAEPEDGFTCEADTDCQRGELCKRVGTLGMRCVHEDSCSEDKECLGIESCVRGRCAIPPGVECTSRAPYVCAPYACDFANRRCFASCASSGQCELGAVCNDGECKPPECEAPNDPVCAPFSCDDGVCNDRCSGAADCADGRACDDGRCVTPPEPPKLGVNAACSEDDACESGYCIGGSCGCADVADCPVDACDVAACNDGVCSSRPMSRGDDCEDGVCDGDGACVGCLGDDDCSRGDCTFRRCLGRSCIAQALVAAASPCEGGVCTAGGVCVECLRAADCEVEDASCESAACQNQVCVLSTLADCDGGA